MKSFYVLITTLVLFTSCAKKTLLSKYKEEISALKTDQDIEDYWKDLLNQDQNALYKDNYIAKQHDSLTITHMIKSALMIEIHGLEHYLPNNSVIEMHHIHNYFGPSQIAYWPIIKTCANARGNQKLIQYPAYQLEGISLTFYNYSVYGESNKHQSLLEKLNKINSNTISKDLYEAFIYQLKLQKLKETEVIGKWQLQSFKTKKEDGYFEFVKMNDNNLYYRKHKRIQKLKLVKTSNNIKYYRVKKEPFGWQFVLDHNGQLSLNDETNSVLISYSIYKD